jgi:alpha-L-fucosidase
MKPKEIKDQAHPYEKAGYEYPQDPLVRKKLDHWQDQKFGLMMHWGLYSILGIVESWGLCSEDQPFQDRGGMAYTEYKEMYFNLIKKFNPEKFDPQPWAEAALNAGMKYVVFSTKHHDGFNMFDTQQSDFKVTGASCPFSKNQKANITGEVLSSFRDKGFMTGVYFSKPDWHHPAYWSPLWATPNRCNNYDVRKYPQRWQEFCEFTYKQIEELMTGYGELDILWLDGGWVRPHSTITDEVRSWGYDIPEWEQDIDMPGIVKMARQNQPGLIVVDRTVHGSYENYRTPEQTIPDELLPFPWETCMTMTQSWGHSFEPEYKNARQLIHTLVDIVAKGGNFLLNIGPTPDGQWEDEAYDRLEEIGDWLKVNGEAIYESRPQAPYKEGNVCFTSNNREDAIYAIYLADENEIKLPSVIHIQNLSLTEIKDITLLGAELDYRSRTEFGMTNRHAEFISGSRLHFEKKGNDIIVNIPEPIRDNPPCTHAWTIKIKK